MKNPRVKPSHEHSFVSTQSSRFYWIYRSLSLSLSLSLSVCLCLSLNLLFPVPFMLHVPSCWCILGLPDARTILVCCCTSLVQKLNTLLSSWNSICVTKLTPRLRSVTSQETCVGLQIVCRSHTRFASDCQANNISQRSHCFNVYSAISVN